MTLATTHAFSTHEFMVVGSPADPVGLLVIQIEEFADNYFKAAIQYYRNKEVKPADPDFQIKWEDNLNSRTVSVPPLTAPNLLEFRTACEEYALSNIEGRAGVIN